MAEMIWKVGFDEQSADKAGKIAGKASASESSKGSGKGGGAFKGGFLGSILGNLLSSVKQLFEPISAMATLLVAALFPLLKPFLILFIKVGLLLFKWLQGALSGLGSSEAGIETDSSGKSTVGDSLKSALFIVGAIIAGIIAALSGAPILLVAAIAVLGGLLISKVGSFLIQTLLNVVAWIDKTFGTNLLEPLKIVFNGIANVFNGLWNILTSLLELDFKGVWEGLKQVFTGLWEIMKGIFLLAWEKLKTVVIGSFGIFKTIGTFIFDSMTTILTTSFSVLKSIGKWILNSVKSFFSFGGGGGSSGTTTSVNDAIITPNGNVIRTNPSDYLIATKTPGSLGGSGSKDIIVNINGGLITEDVARQIGKIIKREINYGGGY